MKVINPMSAVSTSLLMGWIAVATVFPWVVLISILFWLFYVAVSPVLYRWTSKEKPIVRYPVGAILLVFIIVDVIFDKLVGTMIFMDSPQWDFKNLTFTARLRRYISQRTDWRQKVAMWICFYMIEPWDFNHCGLREFI